MARVYVGTYGKYSGGSIAGAWLDLDDYVDRDEFIEACKGLHSDEEDPELMFQDFEGFPEQYYDESEISEDAWDFIGLSQEQQSLVRALLARGLNASKSEDCYLIAEDCYEHQIERAIGEDFAERLYEEGQIVGEVAKLLHDYFDAESYGHDARINGTYVLDDDNRLWEVVNCS